MMVLILDLIFLKIWDYLIMHILIFGGNNLDVFGQLKQFLYILFSVVNMLKFQRRASKV